VLSLTLTIVRYQNPTPVVAQEWRALYRAALYETDRQSLPLRIADAERAIVLRGRELFFVVGQGEEAELLDEEAKLLEDALYALRALRNCVQLRTREPEAA